MTLDFNFDFNIAKLLKQIKTPFLKHDAQLHKKKLIRSNHLPNFKPSKFKFKS